MKRLLGVLAVVAATVALAAAGYSVFKRQIADALYQRAVSSAVGRDRTAELADGLHIFVCGSGSPMPDASRAGPCLGVIAGKRAFVFDVGSGSMRRLARMGFPMGRVERLFLTHLHSDHFDGMGELMLQAWVGGARTLPLPISGPVGTSTIADGFNTAYRIDSGYRIAHHGTAVVPPGGYGVVAQEFSMPEGALDLVLVDEGALKITAVAVDHRPVDPAYGYRVDYKGRSIMISGDTVYDPHLVSAAKGVDVLFHEALHPRMTETMAQAAAGRGQAHLAKVLRDINGYHTSPEDAAKAAQEAGARLLVLYHLAPPLPTPLVYPAFLGNAAEIYKGPIQIAQDGLLISLPAGSDAVHKRRAF